MNARRPPRRAPRRADAWPPAATPRVVTTLPPQHYPIRMASMQGMGDNIHQRAIVRQLMEQNVVYLDTPWPSIYHDLVGPRLYLVRPAATTLRTQAKNAIREASKYQLDKCPRQVRMVRTWYTGEDVRREGSIFAAMVRSAGCSMTNADFRLPVPTAWEMALRAVVSIAAITKPIMLYRPLVERTEWRGCAGRNPDFVAYEVLFESVRRDFFVISVADLVPGKEWLVQRPMAVDLELHRGELTFEMLAALAKQSSLVFCSAGFAPLLAQAVGTPVVCVFGGHESSMTISDGAKFAPTLGIDPIVPCDCFDHSHAHRKEIDIPRAIADLRTFVQTHAHRRVENADATAGRFQAAVARHRLAQPPEAVHESGGAGDSDRSDS